MILNLLLILTALFCGLAVLLILVPFNAIVSFSFKDFQPAGSARFSFLHPLLFTAQVDFATRRFQIRILGRWIGWKRKPVPENEPPADASQPEGEWFDREDAPSGDEEGFTEDTPFEQPGEETTLPPSPPAEGAEMPRPAAPEPPPFSQAGVSTAFPRSDAPEAIRHSVPPLDPAAPQQPPASSSRSIKTEPPPEVVVAPEPEKKDNWYRRLQRNRYLFFLRNTAWRNKIVRWTVRSVRTLFRIVKFDRFRLAIRAGVEDPMVTGTIAGLHQAAVYGLTMKKPYAISFEPVFMTDCFSCSGGLRLGTSLGRLLLPVVVAIATFPTLHTLWLVWRWYRMEQKRKRSAAV
jgi:hypothetical protein